MKILFDQGTPVPLRDFLSIHSVSTAFERGWSTMGNGTLLSAAETEGFDCLVTTDRNLQYQQNLKGRRIAVVVLLAASWPKILPKAQAIADAIGKVGPGVYLEIRI